MTADGAEHQGSRGGRASGRIEGSDARGRCVAIAGALAEAGITRLVLRRDDGTERELLARVTDLPTTIMEAGACAILGPGLRLEFSPGRCDWTLDVATGEAGDELSRAFTAIADRLGECGR